MNTQDQADRLRHLVMASQEEEPIAAAAGPPLVVVSGGKGGVGVTSIAVRLAMSLARAEYRTVLVDANLDQPDVAAYCDIEEQNALPDVMEGRCTLADALHEGPSGVQIVPGAWGSDRPRDLSPSCQRRLFGGFEKLQADVIVADAGSTTEPLAASLWQAASLAMVVTTPDMVAMMDAYATLKLLHSQRAGLEMCVLVNQGRSDGFDVQVEQRIIQACRRFLGITVHSLPSIASDPRISQLAPLSRQRSGGSPAASQIAQLADEIAQWILPAPADNEEHRLAAASS